MKKIILIIFFLFSIVEIKSYLIQESQEKLFEEFTKEIISQSVDDSKARDILINKYGNNFKDISFISEIIKIFGQKSNKYTNNYEIKYYPIFYIDKFEYSEKTKIFKIKATYDYPFFLDIFEPGDMQFYLATLVENKNEKNTKFLLCKIDKLDRSEYIADFDCEFYLNDDEFTTNQKIYLLPYNLPYYANNEIYNSGIFVKDTIIASKFNEENIFKINEDSEKFDERGKRKI